MEEIFFKVNFIPDKNYWEFTIKNKTHYLSLEEFTKVVNDVRGRKLPPGTKGDMILEIGKNYKCGLSGISAEQATDFINYLVKCEDSHQRWLKLPKDGQNQWHKLILHFNDEIIEPNFQPYTEAQFVHMKKQFENINFKNSIIELQPESYNICFSWLNDKIMGCFAVCFGTKMGNMPDALCYVFPGIKVNQELNILRSRGCPEQILTANKHRPLISIIADNQSIEAYRPVVRDGQNKMPQAVDVLAELMAFSDVLGRYTLWNCWGIDPRS